MTLASLVGVELEFTAIMSLKLLLLILTLAVWFLELNILGVD